jgi:tRNA-(ms[2]io[6]A)-hydroxylase
MSSAANFFSEQPQYSFAQHVPREISVFLHCQTPGAWLNVAGQRIQDLLLDHANCEKKAASTAINLMFRYSEQADICFRMSRLAREELRHYEQVLKILQKRGMQLKLYKPSRYAAALMSHVSSQEPQRLCDLLIVGGIIEARSCERFAVLIPVLEEGGELELAKFYSGLLASEARHFEHYLDLAKRYSSEIYAPPEFEQRVEVLLKAESDLITSEDNEFHFHSGVPI